MCVFSCSPLLSFVLNIIFVWLCDFLASGFSEGIHTLKVVLKLCSLVLFLSKRERNAETVKFSISFLTGEALIESVTLFTWPQDVTELQGSKVDTSPFSSSYSRSIRTAPTCNPAHLPVVLTPLVQVNTKKSCLNVKCY